MLIGIGGYENNRYLTLYGTPLMNPHKSLIIRNIYVGFALKKIEKQESSGSCFCSRQTAVDY